MDRGGGEVMKRQRGVTLQKRISWRIIGMKLKDHYDIVGEMFDRITLERRDEKRVIQGNTGKVGGFT